MFTRATGLVIVPLWLAAMGWVFAHDVWPDLAATDPPRLKATDWLKGEGARARLTIEDEHGQLGTIWTNYLVDRSSIRREDVILVERFPVDITPLRILVESVFTPDGKLDEFTLQLDNPGTRAHLHGERFHADFSFTIRAGPIFRTFTTPLSDGELLADAFNPFNDLGVLEVGQTWRMQVFNPVSAATGLGNRFLTTTVTVTGEERIDTGVWEGNCSVVESDTAKAWIDVHGVAQLQEITLPMVGTFRIVRQKEFDAWHRSVVKRQRVRG